MPFYRRTDDILETATVSVSAPTYQLSEEEHADHTYPVDGWYWYPSLDSALDGLPRSRSDQVCTPRQARLALAHAGLLDSVEAWVADQGPATKIEWEYASEIRRTIGLVTSAASYLGMDEDQIDKLFAYAVTL